MGCLGSPNFGPLDRGQRVGCEGEERGGVEGGGVSGGREEGEERGLGMEGQIAWVGEVISTVRAAKITDWTFIETSNYHPHQKLEDGLIVFGKFFYHVVRRMTGTNLRYLYFMQFYFGQN